MSSAKAGAVVGASGGTGGTRRTVGTARAELVRDAVLGSLRGPGPHHVPTPAGTVAFRSIRFVDATDVEPAYIDVRVGEGTESGETHFRIFNPPTLVRDPHGDIVRTYQRPGPGAGFDTVRYRHDPVAAIAEAIAGNGGRATTGRRRRR